MSDVDTAELLAFYFEEVDMTEDISAMPEVDPKSINWDDKLILTSLYIPCQ